MFFVLGEATGISLELNVDVPVASLAATMGAFSVQLLGPPTGSALQLGSVKDLTKPSSIGVKLQPIKIYNFSSIPGNLVPFMDAAIHSHFDLIGSVSGGGSSKLGCLTTDVDIQQLILHRNSSAV